MHHIATLSSQCIVPGGGSNPGGSGGGSRLGGGGIISGSSSGRSGGGGGCSGIGGASTTNDKTISYKVCVSSQLHTKCQRADLDIRSYSHTSAYCLRSESYQKSTETANLRSSGGKPRSYQSF